MTFRSFLHQLAKIVSDLNVVRKGHVWQWKYEQ